MDNTQAIAIINTIRATTIFFIENGHKIWQLWRSFDITGGENFRSNIESLVTDYSDEIDDIIETLGD